MQIRTKLIFNYCAAALLIGLVGTVGFLSINETHNEYVEVVQDAIPTAEAIENVRFYGLRIVMSINELGFMHEVSLHHEHGLPLAAEAAEQIEQEVETGGKHNEARDLDAVETQIIEEIEELEEEAIEPFIEALRDYEAIVKERFIDELDHVEAINNTGQQLVDIGRMFTAVIANNEARHEVMKIKERLEAAEETFINATEQALEGERDELAESEKEIAHTVDNAFMTIVGTSTLAILSAIVLGLVIARQLSRPIVMLRDAAVAIGHGQLETRVTISTKDEIGVLAHAFNDMSDALSKTTVSKNYVENVLSSMADALLVVDKEGIVVRANQPAADMLESKRTDIEGMALTGIVDDPLVFDIGLSGALYDYQASFISKNGEKIPVEISATRLRDNAQNDVGIVLLAQDITERLRIQAALEESREKIVDILESINDAFFAVDGNWQVTYLNQQAENLLQADRNALLGENLWEHLDDLPPWFKSALQDAMTTKQATSIDGQFEALNKWVEVRTYSAQDGVSVYFRDITARKLAEERLNYMANYDALTGLPNRALFMDRLRQTLTRAPWRKRNVAVLFCDLDRFKIINDSLGHNAGDTLLKIIAERLTACIRNGDTVGRLGGDEFVVLLNDMAEPHDACLIAQTIIETATEPMVLENQEVYVTASIGISLFPADADTAQTLLKHADTAMYRAKELGKNRYHLYSADLDARATDRLRLESALRRALENQEFQVYFQSQVDARTGRVTGAEALIRWEHPELGLVSPAEFLPLAEETGLIVPIGEWVLRTACVEAIGWLKAGFDPLRIAVNLSDRQFRSDALLTTIENVLRDTELSPRLLEIELTENIVMQNADNAENIMANLHAMDIQLAIDDFGTGYSSLSSLKRFPIHTLKIDRSFVRDITTDKEDAAIIEAILAMAHKLHLKVIAEGVELEAQRKFLLDRKCDEIQGYLFSKPLPGPAFLDFLKTNQAQRVVALP